MRAHVNGVDLFFDVEGSSLMPEGPTMVEQQPCFILHGGPGMDHSYFRPWLSPLTDKLQLIYVDHRGNGRSQRLPNEQYTIEHMADDLEQLRLYLGLERPNRARQFVRRYAGPGLRDTLPGELFPARVGVNHAQLRFLR